MARRSAKGWWIALCASLVLVVVLASLFKRARRIAAQSSAVEAVSGVCRTAATVSLLPLPSAGDPPVIFWADGKARLFMDGDPAFSSPDSPVHVTVGEHLFEVRAPQTATLSTRVAVAAFEPLLLHASIDGHAGISLVRLGGVCRSCDEPQSPIELAEEKAKETSSRLLADAAAALRRDDWFSAASRLRQVPRSERTRPLFLRLAGQVYVDTGQPELGRRTLNAFLPAEAGNLLSLLASYDALVSTERERRQRVVLERWNKTTERFGALVARFERDAPAQIASAAKRVEHLSQAFERAARTKDVAAEEQAFEGARLTLTHLAVEVRALRPNDCAFQADVVGTLLR